MKNYFKRGLKGEYDFIVGYRRTYEVNKKGEMVEILEVHLSDGGVDIFEYSRECEISLLKKMKRQFSNIDQSKLKGRSLREYEKARFFLDHEDELNRALFKRAKKDGFYADGNSVTVRNIEKMYAIPNIQKTYAYTIAHNLPGHMRIVKNDELAEKLGITLEELEALKSLNPTPAMDEYPLLISLDRLDSDEVSMGLALYGFDIAHYTKGEIISTITGAYSKEEAARKGIRLLTKKEFAESICMTEGELDYLKSLKENENIPDIPFITMNNLDNYSLEDLHAILDGTYAEEYNEAHAAEEVKNESKRKILDFKPLSEKLFGYKKKNRVKYYYNYK